MQKSLFLATPTWDGKVSSGYAQGLVGLVSALTAAGIGFAGKFVPGLPVTYARNFLAGAFLRSECTHMLWVDADMTFSPVDVLQLFGSNVDIVGATCPARIIDWAYVRAHLRANPDATDDELSQLTGRPIFQPLERENQRGPLLEVAGLGAGFMLVRREVIEKLAAQVPSYPGAPEFDVPELFDTGKGDRDGEWLGEDFHFCRRAREAGYQVWLRTDITLRHTGNMDFCSSFQQLGKLPAAA